MSTFALDAIFAATGAVVGALFGAIVNYFDGRRSLLPVAGLRGVYWTIAGAGVAFAILLRHRPPADRAVFDGGLDPLALLASAATLYLLLGLTAIVLTGQMWSLVPDRITLPGIAIGLAVALVVPHFVGSWDFRWTPSALDSFANSIAGAALGGGILGAIALIYWWLRKVEGMGRGCIKLMAFVGAFTGPEEPFVVLLAASVLGAAYGVLKPVAEAVWSDYVFDPRREIDFSSSLAFFSIVFYFWGERTAAIFRP